MIRRILALCLYLFRSLLLSLTGLLYFLLGLAFYLIFFDPRQQTPDVEYYVLAIGLFGAALAFLATLSVASRANQAVNFPFIVRLSSRVEYLAAVLVTSLAFSTMVQLAIALLALIANGPELSLRQALEIPPLWIAANILMIVLALHASDLVAAGWSRVYVFGALGILLYLQSGVELIAEWLSTAIGRLGSLFLEWGLSGFATVAFEVSTWFADNGSSWLDRAVSIVFWPFEAIASATISGHFSPAQALAPAIILLYATILFVLAADLFSTKDLFLTE